MRYILSPILALWLVAVAGLPAMAAEPKAKGRYVLDAVPQGYFLHAYDDCGIPERQPHVLMQDSYCWTFNTSDADADEKSRSAVFSYKSVNLLYTDLDPKLSYALALTYASDHVYNRVQSLWASGVELHEPYALPKAKATRVVVRVPQSVTQRGRMALQLRIHGQVNATVSIVELWASVPPKQDVLRVATLSGLVGDLTGRVLDMAYEPAAGATVELLSSNASAPLATTVTAGDGRFQLPRKAFDQFADAGLRIVVRRGNTAVTEAVAAADLRFQPVRFRPIPVQVRRGTVPFSSDHASHGARTRDSPRVQRVSLDGTWKIDPRPAEGARDRPLSAAAWKNFQVPGQWRQQGFDIPQEQTVAVATEFAVPKEWSDCRVFLRFDAIHAGASYWLNGRRLGGSENLFTPVEWEITSQVRPGAANRLDLEMKVDTPSERLSYSSGYAFHSLGGIDRRVSLFALPPIHVRAMHVNSRLDQALRDAELELQLVVDNSLREDAAGLSVSLELLGPDGRPVSLSLARADLPPVPPGGRTTTLVARVTNPLKWSAEKPHLYRLAVQLARDGKPIERIERNVGFRRVEVRGSQLLVNGVPVKLAGACRHETDPLTGRANTMRHGEEDVKLLKAANLNYIRTSHYPPNMELVDAADKYGMYLEVEAPFCWVAPTDDLDQLREVLGPTSAMIDFYHTHPSVLYWSLGNESNFNRCFEVSHELVRQLDPTRPTTFNNPDPKRVCEIANLHYPPMPYDDQIKDDPRPIVLGEYFFPVCHEQTDVQINPGLRELFGFGHSDPESAFGRQCAESFSKPFMKPCAVPGAWSHIANSRRVTGGAIWAGFDEAFYFPDGTHAGYAWHHGFWGILDPWRRPKPEWWLTKMVFSPVWLPVRRVDYTPGQREIRLPIENRYSFTDLGELAFSWELGANKGSLPAAVPPRSKGQVVVPIPSGTREGEKLVLKVRDAHGELIQVAAIQLGRPAPVTVPQPKAGPPKIQDDGKTIVLEGNGFSLVFDKIKGDFDAADPRHHAVLMRFPVPHMTQYDFGDLAGPRGKPYAVYPDVKTRRVEYVAVRKRPEGVELAVRDRYARLAGSTTLWIDRNGLAKVTCDYIYSGPELDSREAGIRFVLKPACDELAWKRWSEWDVFPDDSICRTEGRAKALRTGKRGVDPEGIRPAWPWSQDQTELGTADFRSVKYNCYEASLRAADGSGLRARAAADRHVRACLAADSVLMHVLTRCPLGQEVMLPGGRLAAECTVELIGPPAGR
ncbi:MAG: glycoside hydrolase family 2 TIM barrel-domain containing protein [Thermoguttaceae bacterium]